MRSCENTRNLLIEWLADMAQFIAKAFLEKDYEAIKAREAAPQPAEDVTMKDADQKVPAAQQPPAPEKLEPGTEPEKVEPKLEEGAAPPPQPSEAIPGPQTSGDAVVKKESEPESTAAPEQAFPETTEGLNFDSMLNTNGGSNSFDLHLDFGNDDMGNQAFLSGTAFGNTASTGDKPGTSQPTGSNTTPAPAGGGVFDLELQNAGGENPFPGPDGGTEDIMGPGESSFDDLFMETENIGDNGTGDLNQLEGDTLMNLNELDDNWF
jgi:hypothetical protein